MKKKKYIILGLSALALYLLFRNTGKGTSVLKKDGSVDTNAGFDGTKAQNLIPDVYGQRVGKDVFASFTGVGKAPWGVTTATMFSGLNTENICTACEESVKTNRYKADVPKIL
jgi:hypothetical protein